MQPILTILIVLACVAWLGYYAYRFFAPRPGRACGGSCCDMGRRTPAATPQAKTEPKGQTVFFSSDDLARRIKARKS